MGRASRERGFSFFAENVASPRQLSPAVIFFLFVQFFLWEGGQAIPRQQETLSLA